MPVALTCSRLRLRASLKACRYLNTAPLTPHAYLRPLVNSATEPGAEELEGVMCLVLDRKEARNALSVQMVQVSLSLLSLAHAHVQELREGIAKAAALPSFVQSARRVSCAHASSRLLLLHTPHSGTFCAGADLRERKTMTETQVSLFLDSLRAMLSELEALLVPTVAVVDGFAMGGGTELALGCDLRVGGQLHPPCDGSVLTSRTGHKARPARDQIGHHTRRRGYPAVDAPRGHVKGQGAHLHWSTFGRGRG